MTCFSTIRSIVMRGALIAGVAWAAPGIAHAVEPGAQDDLQRGLEAQSAAAASSQRAAMLQAEGAQTYKTGLVQGAEAQAQMDQETANQYFARAGVPSCQALAPAPAAASPELNAAEDRLEKLRRSGGWAYKTGAIARAETDVQRLTDNGY